MNMPLVWSLIYILPAAGLYIFYRQIGANKRRAVVPVVVYLVVGAIGVAWIWYSMKG